MRPQRADETWRQCFAGDLIVANPAPTNRSLKSGRRGVDGGQKTCRGARGRQRSFAMCLPVKNERDMVTQVSEIEICSCGFPQQSARIRRTLEPMEKAAAKERETLGKISPGSELGRTRDKIGAAHKKRAAEAAPVAHAGGFIARPRASRPIAGRGRLQFCGTARRRRSRERCPPRPGR